MIVRKAEIKDIPRMEKLLMQVNNVHADGRPDLFIHNCQKYAAEDLEILLEDSSRPIFVGVDEEDCVQGYCFCVITETIGSHNLHDIKSLYIDDLCVDESVRGRGVGREIYKAVTEYAREIGCYHITLNVWSCNPTAMRFYDSLGMKELKKTMEVIL
ncbi:MAG: GNAT family N-acetyltransferase [Lachnospiraceae bacterium]|nr:GNAT family N-acetyltransferase [Lachnospiraceae bacterium]